MFRLFATKITFLWNLTTLYLYNLWKNTFTTQNHIQERVVLFDNVHTIDYHTIIDFSLGDEMKSIVIKNPPKNTHWDVLSIYDHDHKKDLTQLFKRFSHQYNPQTKSFDCQEVIKRFFNTSDNITIVDNELSEHPLSGPHTV